MAGLLGFLRRRFTRSAPPPSEPAPPPKGEPESTEGDPAQAIAPSASTSSAPEPVEEAEPEVVPAAATDAPPATIEETSPAPASAAPSPVERQPLRVADAFATSTAGLDEADADKARSLIDLVTPQAMRFDLPPSLLFAIIAEGSDFDPVATSEDGASGLMQVHPRAAQTVAKKLLAHSQANPSPETLLAPPSNIEIGAGFLHLLDTRTFKDVYDATQRLRLVLSHYVAGVTSQSAANAGGSQASDSERVSRIWSLIACYRPFDATFDALAE